MFTKSRKTYLVVAATLFAWEYFDLRITAIPGLEANLTDGQVALVPRFMALACFYMSYRVTVDWLFFSPSKAASRLDFVVVHFIGLGAIAAYLFSVFYPGEEVQLLGLHIGFSIAMFTCLFLVSLSTQRLSQIPDFGIIKHFRSRRVSLVFWGVAFIINLTYACLIDYVALYELKIASVIAGIIGFMLTTLLLWVVVRVPAFVADSDEGRIVSRINKAFNAEEELSRIQRGSSE